MTFRAGLITALSTALFVGCSADSPTLPLDPARYEVVAATAPSGTNRWAKGTEVTSHTKTPVAFTVGDYCTGEEVALTGSAHARAHTTLDASGGAHVVMHFNYQGVSGTGLTSGRRYHLSDADAVVTQELDSLPYVFTVVSQYHLIGQGPGNNLMLQNSGHVTINSNGEVTAEFTKIQEGACF